MAEQAEAPAGGAQQQGARERPHKSAKVLASKKAKPLAQKSVAAAPPPRHEELPCPRATWKDDPVCADAPDDHTLPTPSSHAMASPHQPDGAPKVQVPGAENLAIHPDIQANNNPRLPGYDSIPMLDSVRKNLPDATVSSPGSRAGLGLDLNF